MEEGKEWLRCKDGVLESLREGTKLTACTLSILPLPCNAVKPFFIQFQTPKTMVLVGEGGRECF